MKLSSRKELLKEADLVLEKIHIKNVHENDSNEETHVAYYSSKKLAELIFGTLLLSLASGPFGIVALLVFLVGNWDFVKGYMDEKKIKKMINDKTLNGDPKLKKALELLIDDLKNNQDLKKIKELLISLKSEYEKNQEQLQDFYRSINSKWYLSKNPDDIVPIEKKAELNSLKEKISKSHEEYQNEIRKQTFLIARKILSSDKYSILNSLDNKNQDDKKNVSRYSYLRRLVKQIEEYFLREIDPTSIKDLKLKMTPKSELPNFGWVSGV